MIILINYSYYRYICHKPQNSTTYKPTERYRLGAPSSSLYLMTWLQWRMASSWPHIAAWIIWRAEHPTRTTAGSGIFFYINPSKSRTTYCAIYLTLCISHSIPQTLFLELLVYTTYLWWFEGWFTIALPTLEARQTEQGRWLPSWGCCEDTGYTCFEKNQLLSEGVGCWGCA